MAAELDSGRAVLGGCIVSETTPRWHCHACQHEWGDFVPAFGEPTRKHQEDSDRRNAEALARGVIDAVIYLDGWAHCPALRSFIQHSRSNVVE